MPCSRYPAACSPRPASRPHRSHDSPAPAVPARDCSDSTDSQAEADPAADYPDSLSEEAKACSCVARSLRSQSGETAVHADQVDNVRHHTRGLTRLEWCAAGDVPIPGLMWIDRLRMGGNMLQPEAGMSPSWLGLFSTLLPRAGRPAALHYLSDDGLGRHLVPCTVHRPGDGRRTSAARPHDGRLCVAEFSRRDCHGPNEPGESGIPQLQPGESVLPRYIAPYFRPDSAILRGELLGPRGFGMSWSSAEHDASDLIVYASDDDGHQAEKCHQQQDQPVALRRRQVSRQR
ncbi:hypothetical protein Tdes44962_MAKER09506 [Teratosphaeria destructans]|uniref:Uncharacterized protein n=1 Tax=Teratosphaeria destructans TaxID=418781 RepID=A0A9W7W324_9PEZI|nr:hypothetical protein Tdes44962_MAKER09506 [Teratosphaeria destructans]